MMNISEKSHNSGKWLGATPISIEKYISIRDMITKECRWYLIGKISERAKQNRGYDESVEEYLARFGKNLGYSEPTLRRFVKYAKSMDCLHSVEPNIALELITGKLRMSVENLISLAKRSRSDIRITVERIKSGDEKLNVIFPERAAKQDKALSCKRCGNDTKGTVKDTPKYDPDAQVTGLTYTIPSWVSAIDRVFMSENIYVISRTARNKLSKELSSLKEIAILLMGRLSEKGRGRGYE